MARLMFSNESVLVHFYNVDFAVGPGCPNKRDDVLLVQYLMKAVFDSAPTERPPGPPLTVDGVAGEITFRHITRVQDLAHRLGKTTQAVDGRVDKAKKTTVASISHTVYTIVNLCAGYKHARPKDYANIALAADCPKELAALFSLE